MKNKIIIIKFLTIVICINVNAQSNIPIVLDEISKNNKTIQATAQYYEAQNLGFNTGLTPTNPNVEYDYMKGSPETPGNEHEFSLIQQLDFPTSYIKKSQLAKTQIAQSEFEIVANRQDVLLEAKKICIELVYHNKLQKQLTHLLQNTEKILADFQIKLEQGDGNMLDVNKAKLQRIEIKKQWQENISAIEQLNTQLTSLNGGNTIIFTDTVYQSLQQNFEFVQLENEFEAADPVRKSLEMEKVIAQKNMELSKSLSLPKIEIGYHFQTSPGQTYNGIHTGISIPLWENRNTIQMQKSKLLLTEIILEEHRVSHYHEIKFMYERFSNLKITLDEYQTIFTTLNNTELLNKALALGEITTIEYFIEINYFTTALNNFLLTEKEFHEVIAELYKFQL